MRLLWNLIVLGVQKGMPLMERYTKFNITDTHARYTMIFFRFAANALVSLLFEVRHNRAVKVYCMLHKFKYSVLGAHNQELIPQQRLESQLAGEGDRVKMQIERKFRIHSKLELQV